MASKVAVVRAEGEEEESPEAEEEEEEELVDPQETVRSECRGKEECIRMQERLDACTARVESRPGTDESCHEEVCDLMHCIDHCAAKKLFQYLK